MDKIEDEFASLRKGLLEFAVLNVVSRHEVYAADILARLGSTPFATTEGTLYPLLSRLKREQLLAYDWSESENGPPRKYYHLTTEGTARLQALRTHWKLLEKSLNSLGGK